MSLVINQNLMATNANQGSGNSFAALADAGLRTTSDPGLRQIARAEIKTLDSADAQPAATAPETEAASGAQGTSAGASATQASPVAPEQQTGSIVNTTDLAGSIRQSLSSLMEANVHQANVGSQGMNLSLMDMGVNQGLRSRLLNMELSGSSSLEDVSGGLDRATAMQETIKAGNQDMLNSVARNADMVSALFKTTG